MGSAPTLPDAITIQPYNFQNVIGEFPAGSGNLLYNLITEEEKQLARECFEILGSRLGLQFVETPNRARLLPRAICERRIPRSATVPAAWPDWAVRNLVVIDAQEGWTSSKFGGDFFETLFHEIGHAIGLGHAYDLPALMGEGLPNDVFPGDNDIVNAQRLWRPDANDIDLYRFEVTSPGTFQAETVAERAASYSFLNTVLTLFSRGRRNHGPQRRLFQQRLVPAAELDARDLLCRGDQPRQHRITIRAFRTRGSEA